MRVTTQKSKTASSHAFHLHTSHFLRVNELWNGGAEIAGGSGRCDHQLMAEQMKDAGLINVRVMEFKMPIGP